MPSSLTGVRATSPVESDWIARARAHLERGEWDAGMAAYRGAIEVDPESRITPRGIELVRVLGRGRLSVRFAARSGDGDFEVEPIAPHLLTRARMLAVETRCHRLSMVSHPDVVRSQVIRHGHHAMLVTPIVGSKPFWEARAEDGFDAERLFHVVDRVGDQLQALHAAGVVHGRLAMDLVAVAWPKVHVSGNVLEPLLSADPTCQPPEGEDVRALGQLLADGLEGRSRKMTTVGLVYRPLIELLAMSSSPLASRASLGRFRAALEVIRFDPGALELLQSA